jgi:hypothetical protein
MNSDLSETPTTLADDIIELARMFDKHGLSWNVLFDFPWPDNLETDLKKLMDDCVKSSMDSLSEEERGMFHEVAVLSLPRNLPLEERLARVKLADLLGQAYSRLYYQQLLKGIDESPLLEALPRIKKHLDKEGLVPLNIFTARHDALEIDGLMVRLLRSIPYDLEIYLINLLRQQSDYEFKIKCALDYEPPQSQENYRFRLREERMWGKPFTPSELFTTLPESPLISIYKRCPKNEEEKRMFRLFGPPLERLEVQRTEKADCLSFMFEELIILPDDVSAVGYVTTRIFHSQYDREKSGFRHVDGTLLIYDFERYCERLDSKISDKVKALGHIKLFRYDGLIPFEVWALTLQKFYPKNELVHEFLEGK